MRISDHKPLHPSGRFVLHVFERGKLVDVIDEPNLVVDLSRDIHARSLGGSSADVVSQFGVGTNGSAPVVGNTGLTGVFLKAIGGVTYPSPNQVKFSFSLGSGEANGTAILEFGLLTSGGRLYARKVRASALNKTADVSFTGSWTISF